jgi:four helix bundle protein
MDTLWAYDLTLIIIIQGYRGETKCLVYGGRARYKSKACGKNWVVVIYGWVSDCSTYFYLLFSTKTMPLLISFTDLVVWQRAHALALAVYHLTATFPKAELFSLTSQLRRAAVSVSANIAEGYKRWTPADQRHFFTMAAGSLAETQALLILSKDLGYLPKICSDTFSLIDETSRLITTWSRTR